MSDDKQTTKHIGEQVPLTPGSQDSESSQAGSSGEGNSNQQGSNPLKPEETQKGITPERIDKK